MTAPFYDEYVALNHRIQKAKGDDDATRALIEELDLRTLDGVPIRLGMEVTDYNFDRTTVVGIQSLDYSPTGAHVPWFTTANNGMFDAGRLWARKPS